MPRQQQCVICQSEEYFEIETEIRRLMEERGTSRGVASEMSRRYAHVQKWQPAWSVHLKKHFVFEKAVKAIDEDEALDMIIERGVNALSKIDSVDPRILLSAISTKTKREETKAKQDMTRAMITAFIGGAKKLEVIKGEIVIPALEKGDLEDRAS